MRGGHHQAFCTFAVEQGHKRFIKAAATFTRVYASLNLTEQKMLEWVCESILFDEVVKLLPTPQESDDDAASVSHTDGSPVLKPGTPLDYTKGWSNLKVRRGRLPVPWSSKFVSKAVRITRLELMRLLCNKLRLDDSHATHRLFLENCKWQFWGDMSIKSGGCTRKFVAVQPNRRDFVRVRGQYENTCLSVQLIVFLTIEGLQDIISVPADLRNRSDNCTSITFALVRWLSPHPNAILRDRKLRPVCSPPFDINHALWSFSPALRPDLTDVIVTEHSDYYPDIPTVISEQTARYDLILPESINQYINATIIDENDVMETITLPFS